ncbi:MAG: Na+/H+ antiporter subunit E [Opitutales bacterium]
MSFALKPFFRSLPLRLGAGALGWVVLTEGMLEDLWLGAVVVGLAVATSYLVVRAGTVTGLRIRGLLRFIGYFLTQSLLGGWDVATRALRPSMPLNPRLGKTTIELEREGSRVLYAWTVSLLPGTASVHLEGKQLTVHFLADQPEAHEELRKLERVVAELNRKPDS